MSSAIISISRSSNFPTRGTHVASTREPLPYTTIRGERRRRSCSGFLWWAGGGASTGNVPIGVRDYHFKCCEANTRHSWFCDIPCHRSGDRSSRLMCGPRRARSASSAAEPVSKFLSNFSFFCDQGLLFSPRPRLLGPSASVALARAGPNPVLFHDPDELRTGAGAGLLANSQASAPTIYSPIPMGFSPQATDLAPPPNSSPACAAPAPTTLFQSPPAPRFHPKIQCAPTVPRIPVST